MSTDSIENPEEWTFNEWEPLARKHGFITFSGRNGFVDGYLLVHKKSKKEIAFLIATINSVQNKILLLTTNSSPILEPVKEAWNINAAALSKFGKEQSEYLARTNPNASKGECES